jgi:hypothetical protein
MIVYINTTKDRTARVMSDLAEQMGVGAAQGIVQRWFEEYIEFVYNTETCDLIFYKKFSSGYWESIQSNLSQLG